MFKSISDNGISKHKRVETYFFSAYYFIVTFCTITISISFLCLLKDNNFLVLEKSHFKVKYLSIFCRIIIDLIKKQIHEIYYIVYKSCTNVPRYYHFYIELVAVIDMLNLNSMIK